MKKIFKIIWVVLCCALGVFLAGTLISCSPMLEAIEQPAPANPDTIVLVKERQTTDTILLAAEVIEIRDTVQCPDTILERVITRQIPAKKIYIDRTVYDTVWVLNPNPNTPVLSSVPEDFFEPDYSWKNRFAWGVSSMILLASWYFAFVKRNKKS